MRRKPLADPQQKPVHPYQHTSTEEWGTFESWTQDRQRAREAAAPRDVLWESVVVSPPSDAPDYRDGDCEDEAPQPAAEDFGEEFGPQPVPPEEIRVSTNPFGAEASGKGQRIPRRGEVGLSSEEIAGFERLGYVMSGSRNKYMNAIRQRKENQVYSAEEQRALSLYTVEERALRESQVIADLKELLQDK
ncbi:MAG: uncharacterized protein KVP18_002871 [Porospora cf. gigantea A]|uniref:uncharacterized protein n=1 Tax=Porospora cf. gigantea A TaxID=2853593 RepID=UPI00355AAC56|nr:MAG: hypothetical protein KVP18_002871 [Porospora cf. gigantea A]